MDGTITIRIKRANEAQRHRGLSSTRQLRQSLSFGTVILLSRRSSAGVARSSDNSGLEQAGSMGVDNNDGMNLDVSEDKGGGRGYEDDASDEGGSMDYHGDDQGTTIGSI